MAYKRVKFAVVGKPKNFRKGRPGYNWVPVAEAMVDKAPKAVFVKANGRTPENLRTNGRKSFDNYFGGSGCVHSKLEKDGVYFWVDLDKVAERAKRP